MGEQGFKVVPADMTHDLGQWNAASEALGRAAKKGENAGTVAFGSFAPHIETIYTGAASGSSSFFTAGKTSLAGMATNLANNGGQYSQDDTDSDGKVRGAGAGGGGGGGGQGQGAGGHGGKDSDHYSQLMSTPNPMPTDPKDPEVTFDRNVDPETGEVSWTQREMKPGESEAIDGRDVERIPQRADRIVVTMVDGEPRITYVDDGPRSGVESTPGTGGKATGSEVRWEGEQGATPEGRVAAGSGAVEPQPQSPLPLAPADEWSRKLPEGADYAVAEVRDGEVHLVFLDVEGNEVTMTADHHLGEAAPAAVPVPEPVAAPSPPAPSQTDLNTTKEA